MGYDKMTSDAIEPKNDELRLEDVASPSRGGVTESVMSSTFAIKAEPWRELRVLRQRAAKTPLFLSVSAEVSRTLARGSAIPALFTASIGVSLASPNIAHRLPDPSYGYTVLDQGSVVASFSFFSCLMAGGLASFSSTARQRPLWPAVVCIIVTFVLNLFVPAFP